MTCSFRKPGAPRRRLFSFDGTISLGSLVTAVLALAGMIAVVVRIEAKVDHESELRQRLEVRTEAQFTEVKTAVNSQGALTREADSEQRVMLRQLDGKLEALKDILISAAQKANHPFAQHDEPDRQRGGM